MKTTTLKTIIQNLTSAAEIDKKNLCYLLSDYLDCTSFNGLYDAVENELYNDNFISDSAKCSLSVFLWLAN